MALYANGGPAWALCEPGDPGATLVAESELPPEGTYRLLGSVLFDAGGVPTMQYTFAPWDVATERTVLHARLDELVALRASRGCPVTLGGQTRHLATAVDTDLIRWTNLRLTAFQMQLVGQGDSLIAIGGQAVPIWTVEGTSHEVTANQASDLMLAVVGFGALNLSRERAAIDLIDAAETPEEVEAARVAVEAYDS